MIMKPIWTQRNVRKSEIKATKWCGTQIPRFLAVCHMPVWTKCLLHRGWIANHSNHFYKSYIYISLYSDLFHFSFSYRYWYARGKFDSNDKLIRIVFDVRVMTVFPFRQSTISRYMTLCLVSGVSSSTMRLQATFSFLDASSHLYKRPCPLVGPLVRPSVRR